MDDTTVNELNRIRSAVDRLTEMEGQDRSLVIEMSQAMIGDLLANGQLWPMARYIRRYCDVLDSPADADRITGQI